MNVKAVLIWTAACAALAVSSAGAAAESAMEKALRNGAKQLTSDEIAERFTGKTVTFESASGGKTFLVYYGVDNDVAGKKVGGGWSDTGYYGVANDDSICLSWKGSDKPRLRCLYVLVVDGVVQKFNPNGSLNGTVLKVENGKIL